MPLDSYRSFNAAAESLIGLYKTELIRRRGPWRGLDDVELATLEYADWLRRRCGSPARPRSSRERPGDAPVAPRASWAAVLPQRLLNHRRLHGACGDIPPVDYENSYYCSIAGLTEGKPAEPSLH